MTEVFIYGPAGRMQGLYDVPKNVINVSKLALILHPHPKYGGTMKNRTVYAISQAFLKAGFATLRINFRGVNMSEGSFDKNLDDELIKDAAAAISWLQEHKPNMSQLWISGFSFGAWMAMNLVMRRPEVTGFVAVSPPTHRYDFSFMHPCSVPGIIIQGEYDQFNPPEGVSALCEKLMGKPNDIQYEIIKNADYKFTQNQHLRQVYKSCYNYISTHTMIQNKDTDLFFNHENEKQDVNTTEEEHSLKEAI